MDIDIDEFSRQITSWHVTHLRIDEEVPFDNVTSDILRSAERVALQDRLVGIAMASFQCPDNSQAAPFDASRCSRYGESHVGNLVADAILSYGHGRGAAIAFANGGGIRQNLNEGNITDKDSKAVLPFANTISFISVTGLTLGKALNNSLSRIDSSDGTGRFLQVAGLRMKFDMERDPDGRVFGVETQSSAGVWSPLDPDSVYRVALPDFIRYGGDGYSSLADGILEATDNGRSWSEVLISYLEDRYPQPGVRPLLHGRIINATKGHAEATRACVSSMAVSELSGQLSDDCDSGGSSSRSYTRITWKIQPPTQNHVALLLKLRHDEQWLKEFNSSLAQPAGKGVKERFEVVPGQIKSGSVLEFDYANR